MLVGSLHIVCFWFNKRQRKKSFILEEKKSARGRQRARVSRNFSLLPSHPWGATPPHAPTCRPLTFLGPGAPSPAAPLGRAPSRPHVTVVYSRPPCSSGGMSDGRNMHDTVLYSEL